MIGRECKVIEVGCRLRMAVLSPRVFLHPFLRITPGAPTAYSLGGNVRRPRCCTREHDNTFSHSIDQNSCKVLVVNERILD